MGGDSTLRRRLCLQHTDSVAGVDGGNAERERDRRADADRELVAERRRVCPRARRPRRWLQA